MTSSDKFCLKWNEFEENIISSFHGLRDDLDFSDVTLVCAGDTQIEAHRVILSACSPFFSSVLKRTKHPHPMIYMRGLKTKDLVAVVDFIYHGETNIYEEDLDGFLGLAEELQLKGLLGSNEVGKRRDNIFQNKENREKLEPSKLSLKQRKKLNIKEEISLNPFEQAECNIEDLNYRNDDKSFLTVEPAPIAMEEDLQKKTSTPGNEGLQSKLSTMMESINDGESNKWRCTVCGKTTIYKNDIRRHVERHIDGVSHTCIICGKVCMTSNILGVHISRYHKK